MHKRIVVVLDNIFLISMRTYVYVKQYDCQHIYLMHTFCRNILSGVSMFKLLLLFFP